MKTKIVLVCGGPSSEHEVSLWSTAAILKNINPEKYEVFVFYIDKQLNTCFFGAKSGNELKIPARNVTHSVVGESQDKYLYLPFLDGVQKNLKTVDKAALMGIHGEFVEDGRLQNILDFFGVKYTGSGMQASVLAMDKYTSTNLIEKVLGTKVPRTIIFNPDSDSLDFSGFDFPVVLKPNDAGSSVGVKILKTEIDLKAEIDKLKNDSRFDCWLLQEYVAGAIELSCGCLEKKNKEMILLPPIEIIPHQADFFDYNSKYKKDGSKEITPPQSISKKLSDEVSNMAAKIHQVLRCKTYSRSDFLVKDKEIYYLETNTLPGMTETSLLPQEAKAADISFSELIDFVIDN